MKCTACAKRRRELTSAPASVPSMTIREKGAVIREELDSPKNQFARSERHLFDVIFSQPVAPVGDVR
jgi:hypothetical protein